MSQLASKLTNVACSLKHWGRTTFGSVRLELRELRKQLAVLQSDPLRVGPSAEERKVQDRLVELSYREEIMMRQRSRMDWLTEGDSNTKYFQRKASARRAKNTIMHLQKPDGMVTSELEEMVDMTNEFYGNLYKSEGCICWGT